MLLTNAQHQPPAIAHVADEMEIFDMADTTLTGETRALSVTTAANCFLLIVNSDQVYTWPVNAPGEESQAI